MLVGKEGEEIGEGLQWMVDMVSEQVVGMLGPVIDM